MLHREAYDQQNTLSHCLESCMTVSSSCDSVVFTSAKYALSDLPVIHLMEILHHSPFEQLKPVIHRHCSTVTVLLGQIFTFHTDSVKFWCQIKCFPEHDSVLWKTMLTAAVYMVCCTIKIAKAQGMKHYTMLSTIFTWLSFQYKLCRFMQVCEASQKG